MKRILLATVLTVLLILGGGAYWLSRGEEAALPESALQGREPQFTDARREIVPSVHIARAVGWQTGAAPVAARNFAVSRFADGLAHPRSMLRLPNGDVLVAETNRPRRPAGGLVAWVTAKAMDRAGAGVPSPDRIMLLRDANGDGKADSKTVFLKGLRSPYGMALVGDTLYVANTDAVMAFPYKAGATSIAAPGRKVMNLPAAAPNMHWTRSLVASPDGSRLYVGVGSNSNIAEDGIDAEENRAAILEIDLRKRSVNIYASGLRNPVGMAWEPNSGELWTVVNERDMLGPDLVPDYLTQVEFAAFYGWPWNYWGGYEDLRVQPPRPDLREYTRRPDYGLGAHVAPLGLSFAQGATLGAPFDNGAFIALHGSWNRRPPAGYKVVFVRFDAKGRPLAKPIDLLTGFLDARGQAQGRPVDVTVASDGALLVSDDVGGVIWRVAKAR
jgi:glucose/arabinose dehydrogenase